MESGEEEGEDIADEIMSESMELADVERKFSRVKREELEVESGRRKAKYLGRERNLAGNF